MSEAPEKLETLLARGYSYGFVTDIESDRAPKEGSFRKLI